MINQILIFSSPGLLANTLASLDVHFRHQDDQEFAPSLASTLYTDQPMVVTNADSDDQFVVERARLFVIRALVRNALVTYLLDRNVADNERDTQAIFAGGGVKAFLNSTRAADHLTTRSLYGWSGFDQIPVSADPSVANGTVSGTCVSIASGIQPTSLVQTQSTAIMLMKYFLNEQATKITTHRSICLLGTNEPNTLRSFVKYNDCYFSRHMPINAGAVVTRPRDAGIEMLLRFVMLKPHEMPVPSPDKAGEPRHIPCIGAYAPAKTYRAIAAPTLVSGHPRIGVSQAAENRPSLADDQKPFSLAEVVSRLPLPSRDKKSAPLPLKAILSLN